MAEPVQLYICYADKNSNTLSILEKQLSVSIAAGTIEPWHRGKLMGGDTRDRDIVAHLDQARIIVMLVSASLFDPEYYN